jgi:hypothetical protein
MHVRFLGGPFAASGPALGSVLQDHLGEPAFTQLDIVVAWAKRSGLRHVRETMRRFRQRGGVIRAIIGIDERGATHQGLAMMRAQADEMWIYRDPSGGTFHPKVYVFRGPDSASAIVGSSNLTRGGLYDNYEASVDITLDLPGDAANLGEIDVWIELLRSQSETCLVADPVLLQRLGQSALVQDEDRHYERANSDASVAAPTLPFGRTTSGKAPVPSADRPPTHPPTQRQRATAGTMSVVPQLPIETRWFKRLDASSAQQPPGGGTNVTGVLRLTRSDFDIDQTRWFRRNLFRDATWRPITVQGSPAERTQIPFDVKLGGRYLGRYRLNVSHAAHREAAQRNVTTVLHWGPDIGAVLRANSYVGSWVVIDRTSGGSFSLAVEAQRPSRI